MLEVIVDNERATRRLAGALAAALRPGDVIALEGELGAGKTAFARGAIEGLGLPEGTAVASPTFALVHQYQGRLPIAHSDFYRLIDEIELEELGLEEILDEGAVLFIEWGRKFAWTRERAALFVDLEFVSDESRRLRFAAASERGQALLDTLREAL